MQKTATILLMVAVVTSCRNSDAPGSRFVVSRLSASEKASMQTRSLRPWQDDAMYRAEWDDGPQRHVCLQPGDLGGFNAFFNVAVFFPNGTLDEQTDINVPEGYEPYQLLQLFGPMVIWFRDPDGKRRDFFREARAPGDWQQSLVAAEAHLTREMERLQATGTNAEIVAAHKARLVEMRKSRERVKGR